MQAPALRERYHKSSIFNYQYSIPACPGWVIPLLRDIICYFFRLACQRGEVQIAESVLEFAKVTKFLQEYVQYGSKIFYKNYEENEFDIAVFIVKVFKKVLGEDFYKKPLFGRKLDFYIWMFSYSMVY